MSYICGVGNRDEFFDRADVLNNEPRKMLHSSDLARYISRAVRFPLQFPTIRDFQQCFVVLYFVYMTITLPRVVCKCFRHDDEVCLSDAVYHNRFWYMLHWSIVAFSKRRWLQCWKRGTDFNKPGAICGMYLTIICSHPCFEYVIASCQLVLIFRTDYLYTLDCDNGFVHITPCGWQ